MPIRKDRGLVVAAAALAVLAAGAIPFVPGPSSAEAAGKADRKSTAKGTAVWTAPTAAQRAAIAKIDEMLVTAAKAKNISPTAVCDDTTFLRRATLDLIGRIPTFDEYQAFLKDTSPDKRAKLIGQLEKSPAFVDRWTAFFSEMLNVRSRDAEGRGVEVFIRKSLQSGKPYDQMALELITATGSTKGGQPAGFLISENGDPFQLAAKTTHMFMGTRISCAQCHNHPFDVWKRQEFYGVAAYFGKTRLYFPDDNVFAPVLTEAKNNVVTWPPLDKDKKAKSLDPSWPFAMAAKNELQPVIERRNAKLEALSTDALLGEKRSGKGPQGEADLENLETARDAMADAAERMRLAPTRDKLADLVTSVQNRMFAESFVNRVWAELLGRGIVNPVDDFRADNPPSHPALLKLLGEEFVASNYDLRALIQMIMLTDAYQRTHAAGDATTRKPAEEMFCAAPHRRMMAEQVYDSMVVAGYLTRPKHKPGQNLREVTETQVVAREKMAMPPASQPAEKIRVDARESAKLSGEAEEAVLDDLLSNPEEKKLAGMEMVEAGTLMTDPAQMKPEKEYVYEYKKVTRVYDFNPSYGTAFDLRTPAPPEHFLRQFGQSPRQLLGDKRDTQPNMRQALILMNGALANEAARVGELEPLWKLLEGDDMKPAIRRIYVDILTREPTAGEIAAAESLLAKGAAAGPDAPTRAEVISDLRWTLLNSLEFRYLP